MKFDTSDKPILTRRYDTIMTQSR